jgi:hypothetical protein
MQTTIYLATAHGGLTVIVGGDGNWRGKVCLEDRQVQCVVADANKRGSVYCGTFGNGLFTSENGGATWEKSAIFTEPNVMALAFSRSGSLYVGTELSAVYRSDDQLCFRYSPQRDGAFLRDQRRITFSRFFQIWQIRDGCMSRLRLELSSVVTMRVGHGAIAFQAARKTLIRLQCIHWTPLASTLLLAMDILRALMMVIAGEESLMA